MYTEETDPLGSFWKESVTVSFLYLTTKKEYDIKIFSKLL